ncbi:hypothetical protein ACT7CZ_18125, partial [Bacillus cereus]
YFVVRCRCFNQKVVGVFSWFFAFMVKRFRAFTCAASQIAIFTTKVMIIGICSFYYSIPFQFITMCAIYFCCHILSSLYINLIHFIIKKLTLEYTYPLNLITLLRVKVHSK